MDALGAFSGIVIIFLIIVAILAFLMPFFVLRIRNEMIKLNRNVAEAVDILERHFGESVSDITVYPDNKINLCQSCGRKNRQGDLNCSDCGAPLV